jgi:hypothetical protein
MPVALTEKKRKAASDYPIYYTFGGHGHFVNIRSITDLSDKFGLAGYGEVTFCNETG